MPRLVAVSLAALAAACAFIATPSAAQSYPSKPVRIIVPFAVGTTTDLIARFVGQKTAEALGQPVITDNRGGAGGIIGGEAGAQSAPGGYTLVWGTNSTHAANVSLVRKLPYDPVRDIAPISGIAVGAGILVGDPNVPVKTVKELAAFARERPGKLTFAPARTPVEIINRLNATIGALLKTKDAVEFFGRNVWDPMPTSPGELGAFVEREIDRWARVGRAAKIPAE